VGGATVLVIEVVGVLPDVEGEEGAEAVHDGVISVGVLSDRQLTLGIGLEPNPAGAKEADAFGLELCLEGVQVPPLLGDSLCQRRSRVKPAMRVRGKLEEIQLMIQDLPSVVEQSLIN